MTTVQAYQTTKNTMTIPSETNTNKTEIPNGAAAASVLAEEDVENPDAMPPPPPLTYRERKINHWESSPFAVGCVNVAWADDNPFAKKKEEEDAKMDDRVGWSGVCCNCLGAGRVGNMAVLRHRMEVYETTEINDTTGEATTVNRKRPKLLCTVGPYWPINLCLTWPLILGISGWTCWKEVIHAHIGIIISWGICTCLLIFSLAMVSWTNPGILYRQATVPEGEDDQDWRWNDQAKTYRPNHARFDNECQVVVEGFDHTCPWTGTAIGAGNMKWFKLFVTMVPICIAYTVVLHVMLGFADVITERFD